MRPAGRLAKHTKVAVCQLYYTMGQGATVEVVTKKQKDAHKQGDGAPADRTGRIGASSRWSALRAVTQGSKTNENMLLFRTLNGDMGRPNANGDHLAPLFRDKLMPLRSKWLAVAPGARAAFRRGLEHPTLGTPGVCNFVDARTKWVDSQVEAALGARITQVVVVAAGYDTRSYRFGASAAAKRVSFFEVDLPEASRKKQELVDAVLSAAAFPRPTFVAADLAVNPLMDVLAAVPDYDAAAATLFTMEGLIYYLPEDSVARLFGGIASRAAPGSRVCFDFLSLDVLEGRRHVPAYKVTARSVANKGEPFVSALPDGTNGVQAFFDGPVMHAAAAVVPVAARAAAGAGAAEAGAAGSPRVAGVDGSNGVDRPQRSRPPQKLNVSEFTNAQEMAARQLPHLTWPAAGSKEPPPMLAFYGFVSAEVVKA